LIEKYNWGLNLISHEFHISEINNVFKMVEKQPEDFVKAVIKFN